ncbi:S1/P1 nuclease, partial [human gut metagenome]
QAEAEAIAAGTPAEWAAETCGVCQQVYEATPEGANLSYDYVAAQTPVVEQQFLRGGLRLARLLNEIYR